MIPGQTKLYEACDIWLVVDSKHNIYKGRSFTIAPLYISIRHGSLENSKEIEITKTKYGEVSYYGFKLQQPFFLRFEERHFCLNFILRRRHSREESRTTIIYRPICEIGQECWGPMELMCPVFEAYRHYSISYRLRANCKCCALSTMTLSL